jgi:hypothetical protein
MSKLIDYIIDEIRETSDNEDFDATVGITEEEIVKYINDAENRLHSKISSIDPYIFIDEQVEIIVVDQEAYTLDFRAHLKNKVVAVEYSYTGNAVDYVPLRPVQNYNRRTGADGSPSYYIQRAGKILLLPTPTSAGGKLRISYGKQRRRLDKRRGQVKAVTLDSGTSTITNLEINFINDTSIDTNELSKRSRCTVIDKYGNIKMDNILISSLDLSGSYDKTITVDSSYTYASGETIAVDDYVVSGEYTSSHSEFDEEIERYTQAYVIFKVLKKDSSVDSAEATQELLAIEEDVLEAYKSVDDDINEIPLINNEEDWGL